MCLSNDSTNTVTLDICQTEQPRGTLIYLQEPHLFFPTMAESYKPVESECFAWQMCEVRRSKRHVSRVNADPQ